LVSSGLSAESASRLLAGSSQVLKLFEECLAAEVDSPKIASDLLLNDLPKIFIELEEDDKEEEKSEAFIKTGLRSLDRLTSTILKDLANAKSSGRLDSPFLLTLSILNLRMLTFVMKFNVFY